MSTPMERAAAIAQQARDKLKAHDWTITRPGQDPYTVHLQPAQDWEWVAAHYPGAAIVQGKYAP